MLKRLTLSALAFLPGAVCLGAVQFNVAQEAYLKASNTQNGDIFGESVTIWGDTLVVGARGEDSAATGIDGNQFDESAVESGAAYVFVRDGSGWSQQAYIKASNTGKNDYFGRAMDLEGDTLVISAPLEDSDADGVNGDQLDQSAPNAGAVYVFERSGTTWAQTAYLKASNSDSSDHFGSSVSLSGDTLVVGAREERSASPGVNGDQSDNSLASAGAAYVFVRSGSSWVQQAYIKASNPGAVDRFGYAVAVSGDRLAVGASQESSAATGINGDQNDNSAVDAGAVYAFERVGTTWSQVAYIKASNTDAGDYFGRALDLDGETLVVGAYLEDSAATGSNGDESDNNMSRAGAVYIFGSPGSGWVQETYLKASNSGLIDNFGYSIALVGDSLLVGAIGEDSSATCVNGDESSNAALSSGAAYLFERNGTAWNQVAYLKAFNAESSDRFGSSIDLSLDTAVVSAPSEKSNATGVNGDGSNNSSNNSGAAYAFDLFAPPPVITSYCFGDGSGNACPCTNGSTGAGCASSSTSGAVLTGSGLAQVSLDTFALSVSGIPAFKVGLCIKGTNALGGGNGNVVGDGLLCLSPQVRSQPIAADASGNVTMSDWRGVPFGQYPLAYSCGVPARYQWWYRDPLNTCSGQGFNFSNGVSVTWQ